MTNHKNWQALFYQSILNTPLQRYLSVFAELIDGFELNTQSKEVVRWRRQLEKLPSIDEVDIEMDSIVSLRSKTHEDALNDAAKQKATAVLRNFMPWRKGPFNFFGIEIDTEWRSDIKWERVKPHLPNLADKRVLDVGCGSGYHLFRMYQNHPKQVVGIDPTLLFFYQFQCFKRYLPELNVHFLPIGIETMPSTQSFDCVFSMGVLYHRPDPIKFLKELKSQLTSKGTLILETLIVDGDQNTVFVPPGRYAKMRNVWFIPSAEALTVWLKKVGFNHIKCVDKDVTTFREQRSTQWMQTQSLSDFLDPDNIRLTVEGYPAPKRAIFTATQ